ncbi:hypothetical protein [Rhizobium binxianense]
MDVILFLLKAVTKLSVVLTGLVFAVVTFVLAKFGGALVKRAHQPAPQQAPQPVAAMRSPEPAVASPMAPPAVHVHVHMPQMPVQPAPAPTMPEPVASAPLAYVNQSTGEVLNRPDHRIYITTGSHLMMEHPTCDYLLERLDYHLYVAAHRDGDPFTFGPPLDTSGKGVAELIELPPVAVSDDYDFASNERRDMPPPDGGMWLRRAGYAPYRLGSGAPS